ncbi:SURF1 family protein [Corynebacterium aquatimens]|nr:SURF1 family protein [Corynebacterium aquatimens]UIZ93390.1 SURF1 family protein [Corynebacterium sp. CNCTC7651]
MKEKPWWRTFLTPGWVIAALLIVAFSYFAFTVLAPWQLNKNERLEQRNEHIVTAFEQDPVPLGSVLRADGTLSPEDEWTRVTATGRYIEPEVLLRLRPVDRTPAFQALTPFQLDSGEVLLVNRGWVPAQDSTKVPDIAAAPTQTVTLTGMLRVDEGTHPTAPMHDQGYQMVYSISPPQIAELTGTEMLSPYLQLLEGEPGVLTPIPLPQLETGNHLSYGLQWIAFGILAPAGLIYFIAAETRERRRFREEQEQLLIDAPLNVDKHQAPPETRARYGHARRNPWATAYDKEQDRTS